MTYATDRVVILDDGECYVELNRGDEPDIQLLSFLKRRCYISITSPEGYECIGSVERDARCHWLSMIDAPLDPYTGIVSRLLRSYPERLAAVMALWNARHQAYCRHADDCAPAARPATRAHVGCR